jgi:rsbT co-antagonist protein RsbR
VAIIDITGVSEADAQVANGLIEAARAVRLLGAQAVFTGIHPEVARLFVRMNIHLDDLITYSTLQAGIEHAMGRGGTRR